MIAPGSCTGTRKRLRAAVAGRPLRSYGSRLAEASALAALERSQPGGSCLEIDHGPDEGPDAEAALVDAWQALGGETAARVWCAAIEASDPE